MQSLLKIQPNLSFRVRYWLCIISLFVFGFSNAQISIAPVPPACAGDFITLEATVTGVLGTESYSFEQFPYSPESYEGGTPVIMTDDDVFPEDNIGLEVGFPFCFLNSSVDHFWIGSNGWISFLPNQPTTWLPTQLPNPDAPKSAIFAPWQDWDPGVGPQAAEGYVFYRREGVTPYRRLIVYWKDCPMYNCNDLRGRFQIVIYETTNIIDNHITLKPECDWQSNTATQGIQNATGTPPVYIAFGRNQNSWSVLPGMEESTHFVPSGITWHEGSPTGPVVGSGDHINIIATVSTTYWAVLAACDNTGNYQASVDVIVYPLPVPSFIGGDIVACQGDIKVYTADPGNHHYTWEITGGVAVPGQGGGVNDNWIGVQWTVPGANSITVNYTTPDGCTALTPTLLNVTVNAFEPPVITTAADEFCPEEEVTFSTQAGKTDYEWEYMASGAALVSGGSTVDNFVVLKWSAPGPKSVFVNYTDAGCTADPPASKQIIIKEPPVVNVVAQQYTCSGNPTAITLNSTPPGAGFSWDSPSPACSGNIILCPAGSPVGTQISDVLSVSNFDPGTVSYFITPQLDGCTGPVYEITVIVNPLPDVIVNPAPSTLCSGEPANITFSSSVTYTNVSYNWTVPVLPPGISMANTTGSGEIQEVITNLTNEPIDIEFSIMPDANGCLTTNPTSYTKTVYPLPDVVASPPSPLHICSGNQADVLFSSSVTFAPVAFDWNLPSVPAGITIANTAGTTAIHEVITNSNNFPSNVTFNIMPMAAGCSPSMPSHYTVTVNPLPDIHIYGPSVACVFAPGFQYTTEPGQLGYTWNVTSGTYTSGTSPDIIDVTWTSTGLQSLSVNYTNQYGCVAATPASYTVDVQTLPVPTVASGPEMICTGIPTSYETQAGMSGYQWTVSPDGVFSGENTYKLDVTWTTPGIKQVSVNYQAGPGCTGASPGMKVVTVNQSTDPVITSIQNPICQGNQTSYTTQAGMTDYTWVVTSGGEFTTATSGNIVTVRWNNPGAQFVSVNFTNPNGCISVAPAQYNVQVNPLPVVNITAPGAPYCQNFPDPYIFSVPPDPGSSFEWTLVPVSGSVIIPGSHSGEILVTFTDPGTSAISVKGTNQSTGCFAISDPPLLITVYSSPDVSLTSCFDLVTTKNAKKFKLSGGHPLGASGKYTIDLITGPPVNYFDPAALSVGTHTVYYSYSNANGCIGTAHTTVQVNPSNGGIPCNGQFTDPRDNTAYEIIQIGAQCWMQENLRYGGATVSYTKPQTNNCIFERNCLTGDPDCSIHGGFYQWDELMQYDGADKAQGFCPPGWHIPNEAEWNLMTDIVSGGVGAGVAGSFLQDPNPNTSFLAGAAGIFYLNAMQAFSSQPKAAFFWTSSFDIATKTAVAKGLNTESPSVSRYLSSSANSFPVRCVKD